MGLRKFPLLFPSYRRRRQGQDEQAPLDHDAVDTEVAPKPVDLHEEVMHAMLPAPGPLGCFPSVASGPLAITAPQVRPVQMQQRSMQYSAAQCGSVVAARADELVYFYDTKVRQLQNRTNSEDHLEIQGTLYTYLAVRAFGDSSGLFKMRTSPLVMLGLHCIVVVQVIGPFAIALYAYQHSQFTTQIWGVSEWYNIIFRSDDAVLSVVVFLKRVLAMIFIFLFSLNGLYVIETDRARIEKIIHLFYIFRAASLRNPTYRKPNEYWLWVGVLVNVWVLITCCICMWPLFIIAEDGPKDVVYDALALTFLYNLDDIGGDMGFLDHRWNAEELGEMYGDLADQSDIMRHIAHEREGTFTPDNIYEVGSWIVSLLTVALPILFFFTELESKEKDSGPSEVEVLQNSIAQLQQQVQELTNLVKSANTAG